MADLLSGRARPRLRCASASAWPLRVPAAIAALHAATMASPSPLPARQVARSSALADPAMAVDATTQAKGTHVCVGIAGSCEGVDQGGLAAANALGAAASSHSTLESKPSLESSVSMGSLPCESPPLGGRDLVDVALRQRAQQPHQGSATQAQAGIGKQQNDDVD